MNMGSILSCCVSSEGPKSTFFSESSQNSGPLSRSLFLKEYSGSENNDKYRPEKWE